jgi:hypothetical protein
MPIIGIIILIIFIIFILGLRKLTKKYGGPAFNTILNINDLYIKFRFFGSILLFFLFFIFLILIAKK